MKQPGQYKAYWYYKLQAKDEHRFWVVKIGEESSPILNVAPDEHCIEMYPSLTEMLVAEAECFEKAIELVNYLENLKADIYPGDIRLMDIRHKHGYKLRYF